MLLIFLVFYVVLLYVFTLWVPCSDVGYDFRIKTMFGLFLSQVVCRRTHVLLCFCACLRIVMSNILSYQMSLHSEFRVAMSATISAWERYSVGLFPKLFVRLLMSYLCYLCLFVNSNVQHTLTIWVTWRVHWEKHDCLISTKKDHNICQRKSWLWLEIDIKCESVNGNPFCYICVC